jgi:orotate phosphoribosyltransferase
VERRDQMMQWCRDFIEHNCILRCPGGKRLLVAPDGAINSWQFYFPIAVLNQQFAQYVAELFWERFGSEPPFQICACESGGIPLLSALQAARPVNGFVIKKRAKDYGIGNWLEGVAYEDVPVLLIDDVMGSGRTLAQQASRLIEFGFKLRPEVFCIAMCKSKGRQTIRAGEQELEVTSLFDSDDFIRSYSLYAEKYGKPPQFHGTIV